MTVIPIRPMDDATQAVVESVANDYRAGDEWERFKLACVTASLNIEQTVDPNQVRDLLTRNGELTVNPKRLASFWLRATTLNGFLDNTGIWTTNTDRRGRNYGKPIRVRKLRNV